MGSAAFSLFPHLLLLAPEPRVDKTPCTYIRTQGKYDILVTIVYLPQVSTCSHLSNGLAEGSSKPVNL